MKRLKIILFVLALYSGNLIGQIPTADFNLPVEVCLEEQFQLGNTSSNAISYEWDFCYEDFSTLSPSFESFSNSGLSLPFEARIVETDTSNYVFIPNRSNNSIKRYHVSKNLETIYSENNVENIAAFFQEPISIDITYIENKWIAFAVDFSLDKVFALDFGNNLNSAPVINELVLSTVVLDGATRIHVENSIDSTFLFLSNFNTPKLSKVVLDQTDLSSIFIEEEFPVPGAGGLSSLDIIKSPSNNWIMLLGQSVGNNVTRLKFNSSLNAPPIIENLSTTGDSFTRPTGPQIFQEGNDFFALLVNRSGAFFRLDFGSDLESIPVVTNYGIATGSNASWSLDIIKNENSRFHGLFTRFNTNLAIKLSFNDFCTESPATSTEFEPLIKYTTDGTKNIILKASNSNGESETITKSLIVNSSVAPTGNIVIDTAFCVTDNISFGFNTADAINSYSWNFGDGNASMAISPNHQYATAGEYYITLEVESTAGCPNIFYDTLTILPEPQPVFTTTSTEYCTFEPISFSNTTAFDYGDNVQWSWDFDGEGSTTEENPSFSFETAGTKTITLEAHVLGCVETFQLALEIIDGPQPAFEYDKNCLGEDIQLTNLSEGANITGYQWDFGNGEISTEENPQTIYNIPGNYTIELRVSNASGCENTTTQNIQIFDEVVDSIIPTEAIENLLFKLGIDWRNDFDSTQNLTYQWDINGEIQTTDTASYSLALGVYTVNLEVTNASNCSFTTSRTLEVGTSVIPTPDFNLPVEVCLNEKFQLANNSVNSETYLWDFCTGNFTETPAASEFSSNKPFSTTNHVKIFRDETGVFAFVPSRGTSNVYRARMGEDLELLEEFEPIVGEGTNISGPIDIDIIQVDENYIGYVIDFDNRRIYKLDFGNSLSNQPAFEDLGQFAFMNGAYGIAAIKENGLIKLLISNFSNNNLGIVSIDTDSNIGIETVNLGNSSRGVDLYVSNNTFYGAVAIGSIGIVRILDFGNTVNTTITNTYDISITDLPNPNHVKLFEEGDNLQALVYANNSNLANLNFGDSFDANPTITNYGNLGVLNTNNRGFDVFQNQESNWKALFIETSGNLKQVHFDKNCGVSSPLSNTEQPQISYSQPGTYPITLTAFHPNGNSASMIKELTVSTNQSPEGTFTIDSAYCIVDNISFSFNTSDDIATYNWDFGDGNTSTEVSPTHQYATDGEYFISLEVESAAGCPNIFYDTLTILPEPQPEFSTLDPEYCTFEPIGFSNTTPFDFGENVAWSWDFNGEGSSTEENPNFTFETAGTKIITLEANVLGCVQTYQSTLEIIEGPQVDFSYDSNCLGEAIQFTNLSTGANITGYQWDFGNGESSMEENPQITYNNGGTYAVVLTVTNASGCENTFTQNIQIFETVVDSIMATEAIENLPFNLGIEWNNDFDSTQNLSYQWEINSEVQTSDTVTYTLGQGTYTVNLEVSTAIGCLFTTQRLIEVAVSENPSPAFILPEEVCQGEQFQIENTSVNTDSVLWDFCTGNFDEIPVGSDFLDGSPFTSTNNVKIFRDGSELFAFIPSRGTSNIYRASISENLELIDGFAPLINESSNISGPIDIDIVRIENNYLGFVIDFDNRRIYKLDFGNSLANQPELEDLGQFAFMNGAYGIAAIQENGFIKLVVSNFSNNNLGIITIDNANNLAVETINLGSRSRGVDLLKRNDNYYGAVAIENTGTIRILDFGSSVNIIITNTYDISIDDLPNPNSVKLIEEGGNLQALVYANNSNLANLNFGSLFSDNPTITSYGNVEILNTNMRGFDIFQNEESNWKALFIETSGNLKQVHFDKSCGVSSPLSNTEQPQISYTQPGTYPITLTAYHPNGNSASITKEITVSENQAPEIAFSAGESLCISAPIQFSSETNAGISSYTWDFGDGESSTEANPEHLFANAGEYLVQLSVTDTAGCNNLFQDSITVYAEPQADFQTQVQGSICSQKPVVFENTTTLPTTATFLWDLGDGTTSTEENPEHIYVAEGEYIVRMQIEMAGCLVEKTDTILVNPGPLVDFNYTDDCFGQVVNFENISTGEFLESFQWNFGDGTQSTQLNPNHSYDSAGTYNVQLTALTSNGCDYTFQKEVRVNPVATVAFESEVACASQPVQFNEQVTLQQSNITDYLWDFGVSGTSSDVSTEANPQFTFPTAGSYQVRLQVTTADGCTTSGTQTVTVNALPQPSFSYEENCLNNAILFTPENTDNIIAHFWELKNQAGEIIFTAQSENFSYAFEIPDNYQLRYRQQNENLCSNSITETVAILPLPEPDFALGNICANEAVFFENLTDLKGNTLKNYSWSIDGEEISTDFRPQYTFEESGDFLLNLQVETQNGCIQNIEKTISVSPAPVAFFELEQTLAAVPYTLSVNGTENRVQGTENADRTNPTSPLGTEGLSTSNLSTRQLANLPTYTADEYLVSSIEYRDSTENRVQGTENADRTNPTSPLGTEGLSTSNLSTRQLANLPTYIWTLNGDTISSTAELNHVIEQPGTYLLGLIVTNEAGCSDSHYEQIRVREPSLDIALNNLRITKDQDFTGFVLNISNRGTVVPERLDLEINLGSYSLTETIEAPLLPESNRNVALSIKLTEEQLRGLAKICIQAIPHSSAANETNLNNNRVCTNLESGLNIMEIYPNPVATKFTLPIIIPENASVNLSLEQANGQTVKTYSYDLEAGYHEIQIDRDNLKPGIYILRIRYQGEEKVKKIIFQ